MGELRPASCMGSRSRSISECVQHIFWRDTILGLPRSKAYFGRGILRHAPLFRREAALARGVVGTGRCGCYGIQSWDKPEVVPPMVEGARRSVFWEGHPPACPTFQPRSGVGARRGGGGAAWLPRVSFLGQAGGCPSQFSGLEVVPPGFRRSAWQGLRRRGIGLRGRWRVCISTACSSRARARDF